MYYGSTADLKLKNQRRRSCLFFVFDDSLVVIELPLLSILDLNKSQKQNSISSVYNRGVTLTKNSAYRSGLAFATVMKTTTFQSSRPVSVDEFSIGHIDSVLVSETRTGAEMVVTIGNKEVFHLQGPKKEVSTFAGILAKPLGKRVQHTKLK